MLTRRPVTLLMTAWVLTLLGARMSPELASAVSGLAWAACALLLLRRRHLADGMTMSVGGLAAAGLALMWWFESFGVVDPASAVGWLKGWVAPLMAAFVMNRHEDSLGEVQGGVAWLGAGLGLGATVVALTAGGRGSFVFGNPNVTAAVLVGALPMVFALPSGRRRAVAGLAMAVGLAATGSRGGLLAAVVALSLWALVRRGDRRVLGLALAMALLATPFVAKRFVALAEDPYAHGRALWWRSAWRVMSDHPGGVGTRQFGWHGLRRRDAVDAPVYSYLKGEAGESAHSEWVQLAVDHGPFGPALLLVIVFGFWSRRPWRLEHLGVAAMLIHAAVDGTWQNETVRTLLLVHAMALWRGGIALPWALPTNLAYGAMLCAVMTLLPGGYGAALERRALRADRAAARQGRVDALALEQLEKVQGLQPLNPSPAAARATALMRAHRWQEAMQAMEEALRRAPARPQLRRQARALYAAAALHWPEGRVGAATMRLRHARAAVRLQTMHAVDRFAYAQAAVALGYPRVARRQLRIAVSLEPNFRVAHHALAAVTPLKAQIHLDKAAEIRSRLLERYCPLAKDSCKDHIGRVMTRLELRLVGDLVNETDATTLQERFVTWPRPPLAPWPKG